MGRNIATVKTTGHHRIMSVTLHCAKSDTPITIICSYDPLAQERPKKHDENAVKNRRNAQKHPNKHIIMWRADANGKLGQPGKTHLPHMKIIGPDKNAPKTEPGNGSALRQICQQHHMIPMSTWEMPPLTNGGNKIARQTRTKATGNTEG